MYFQYVSISLYNNIEPVFFFFWKIQCYRVNISKLNESFFGLRSGVLVTPRVRQTKWFQDVPLWIQLFPRDLTLFCQDFITAPNTLSSTKCTLTISETINLKIPVWTSNLPYYCGIIWIGGCSISEDFMGIQPSPTN